jgi:O-antigen/teichoic acid export membrane protein
LKTEKYFNKNLIKLFILEKLGIDKAIIFTSSSSILNAFGSVFSVFLVVKFMTNLEQGYFYTFGSIVAIQIFFELGLNTIITQYAAHENAHLYLDNNFELEGPLLHKSRISSLLRFSIKWYSVFSILLLICLIIAGFIFFKKFNNANNIKWTIPWILLAIGTSLNLFISPIIAFLQGIGKVKELAKYQFFTQFIRLLIVWVGLYVGLGLFVLGLGSICYFIMTSIMIIKKYYKLIYKLFKVQLTEKINYFKEIFPFQWKIAISWISGYFIFQLFNPVLFATEGPQVAGQMGLTLAALNGILSLSLAWINTKVPFFSNLIANKNYIELDISFKNALKQSLGINIFLLVFFALIISSFHYFNITISGRPLSNRFLGFLPLFFLMIPIILNHIVASWATYLRCHKKEPFLLNSLIGGILCTFSTIYAGTYFGVRGITFGYMIINIFMFPWSYNIFITKKNKWHNAT